MAEIKNDNPSAAKAMDDRMEKIISLCKRRGFIYPASEIYGGFANAFDFGPLGSQLKKNLKDLWWRRFVTEREDIVGLDSAIIQNPKAWVASGHVGSFSDPLIECTECHSRYRVDHMEEGKFVGGKAKDKNQCPSCGSKEFTEPKEFNLMFKTFVGVTEDSVSTAYLRPETAQGIFLSFKNVIQSTRIKPPFGIAQIGKAFRNEITPGNYIFRTREFEQGEIEFFIKPTTEESEKWYKLWLDEWMKFFLDLGIKEENLTIREHAKEELSHYSSGTSDIEYNFPFGVSELAGVAQRTDFDLTQHEKHSGQDLKYFDEATGEKYVPFVVEPTMGIDRAMLACLVDAYDESDGTDGRQAGEVTMRLSAKLAPIKVAVFPLVKKEGLPEIAHGIAKELRGLGIEAFYDESGSVGRRYRRQDEIGTPWCVTVDFDSLTDKTVTLRDRDSMKQERVSVAKISEIISNKLK
ncbi:MAG: glycine--tRNA ligase [Candidatus Berkelbacteria bacterium]